MITNSCVLSKSLPPLSPNKPGYKTVNRSMTAADVNCDSGRVEICELDNSCANPTTVSLMRCKKQILHPFRKLICLIGWRPFAIDSVRHSSTVMRILNILYPIFVFALLLFNYAYEILVCQGKLNVSTTPSVDTTPSWHRNLTNMSLLLPGRRVHRPSDTTCGHIITMYIIPDILHCAAFLIGFVYFRSTEGEPMYALMEKVLIHADQSMRLFSPNRVIRRLKIFFLIGCIWVFMSIIVHALSVVITDFQHHGIFDGLNESKGRPVQYSLFIIDVLCLTVKNCIHLAVAMNFVAHCELVIFYCKGIRTRLEEKSIQLLEAMKQILDLRSSITQLNGAVSRMMSLLVVYFLGRTILGIILFMVNKETDALTYIYRALYPVIWISILIFCLAQAGRVTSKCDKFHRLSHSMRIYGYHSTTPSELDGFLLFISAAELRAKLCGLTIRPGNVIFIIVTILIAIIILIQTDLIRSAHLPL